MNTTIEINGRKVGPGHTTYIVAEMSANHGQSYERAVELVKAAKAAGADAIKLQTYSADTMTIDCNARPFQIGEESEWAGQTLYQLYQKAHTPWEWQPELKRLAEEIGLDCFSTPFDTTAVDFLEEMDVPAYKIASFELVDLPLIETIARKGRLIILSTGLSCLAEVDEAVRTIRQAGNPPLALLVCNSAYPAPPSQMNLRRIPNLAEVFQVPVGLSDHTLGWAAAVAAVALGACIIEKHLTLSRSIDTPDSFFSMEPEEFKTMVEAIRTVEQALGEVRHEPTAAEVHNRVFRRSLFVVEDLKQGEEFTRENVRSIRPGFGLPPRYLPEILGRRATRDLPRGTPLQWSDVGS